VVGVEQWAEIRRMDRVERLSIREINKRTGLHRKTIRRALAAETPPADSRSAAASKLDPFKAWICEQLQGDPRIQSLRLREMAAELGYDGGKTIFDDYVGEVGPRFLVKRTFQRTIYRPGELVQCDLWEPTEQIPVGYGQTRRGYVVTVELCWSRVVAGALIFSKEAPDVLWGLGRCLDRIGALPEKLVWDREAAIAGGGRPTDAFACFCGQFGVGWVILDAGDAQAKGLLERSHRFMRSNFEPGRRFANPTDFQLQFDGWCARRSTRGCIAPSMPSPPSDSSRSKSGCGRSRRSCRTPTGGWWCVSHSSRSCAWIATITRSTRRSPGAASRFASPSAR